MDPLRSLVVTASKLLETKAITTLPPTYLIRVHPDLSGTAVQHRGRQSFLQLQ